MRSTREAIAARKAERLWQTTESSYRITVYDNYNNAVDTWETGATLEDVQKTARSMLRSYEADMKERWGDMWRKVCAPCRVDIVELRPVKSFDGKRWISAQAQTPVAKAEYVPDWQIQPGMSDADIRACLRAGGDTDEFGGVDF